MRAEIPGDSGRDTVEWLDDLIENASRRGRGKLKWLLDSVRSEIVLERDLAEKDESRRKTGGK